MKTTVVPRTRRAICSSVDPNHTLEQREIESISPVEHEVSIQPRSVDVAGSTGDVTEMPGKTCAPGIGNTKARRITDGKTFHLKGQNHRNNDGTDVACTSNRKIMLSRRLIPKLECVSCFEKFPKWKCIVAPCSHVYCRACTISLIETCIQDESFYPIKCCKQPLSKNQLNGTLNTKRRATFESKCREFNTSPDLRAYCCNPQCSTFLGSSTAGLSDVTCRTCRTSTCIKCKQRSHANETCQGNADILKVQELARKKGWQTCPGCKSIVELHEGCYHMTCRCRTEFCYLCGEKWKKCKCMQYHEEHILANAPVVGGNGEGRVEQRAFKHILMRWIRRLRR